MLADPSALVVIINPILFSIVINEDKGGQDTLRWHAQVGPVPSLAAWLAACASLAVL